MTVTYYPRDAMLAWYYHTYSVWPCICPSVCHKSTFYGNIGTDRIVLAWRLLSTYHTVL